VARTWGIIGCYWVGSMGIVVSFVGLGNIASWGLGEVLVVDFAAVQFLGLVSGLVVCWGVLRGFVV